MFVEWVTPIQERVKSYLDDVGELDKVLAAVRERAREVASRTLADVYERIGFLPPVRGEADPAQRPAGRRQVDARPALRRRPPAGAGPGHRPRPRDDRRLAGYPCEAGLPLGAGDRRRPWASEAGRDVASRSCSGDGNSWTGWPRWRRDRRELPRDRPWDSKDEILRRFAERTPAPSTPTPRPPKSPRSTTGSRHAWRPVPAQTWCPCPPDGWTTPTVCSCPGSTTHSYPLALRGHLA